MDVSMTNELHVALSALLEVGFVFVAARLGSQWLFGTIAANLILANFFGSSLITVFGYVANAGNVFYVGAFLAAYFFLEKKESKKAHQTIWFGTGFIVFFFALSQGAMYLSSIPSGVGASKAIETLFTLSPRIALASILAYMFAQYVNIFLYTWISTKTSGKLLWLRTNVANTVAQFIDSCIFISIAFPDLLGTVLMQTILVGWAIKTSVVLLGTPLLYLDGYLDRNK